MKKVISLVLATMLICCNIAFAADETQNIYSVTVNEYDVYVAERAKAQTRSYEADADNDPINKVVISDAIEQKLLQLSQMSDSELVNLGYSQEQIIILHNYKGERIETYPALRSIFASMTATFYKESASNSSMGIRVEWVWSSTPFLNTVTDTVVLRWKGTNSAGSSLNLAVNKSKSSCTERFYSLSTGNYSYSKNVSLKTKDAYGCVYASIPMTDDSNSVYAKTGRIILYVDKTGSNSINEAAFSFAYGHTTGTASVSFSLPVGFGISFSSGCDKMVEKSIRMSSTGKITAY